MDSELIYKVVGFGVLLVFLIIIYAFIDRKITQQKKIYIEQQKEKLKFHNNTNSDDEIIYYLRRIEKELKHIRIGIGIIIFLAFVLPYLFK